MLHLQCPDVVQVPLPLPSNLIRLGLSTTLTSEDKNGDFETSLKVKNKDYILMYNGLGAKIDNISTNEVVYPINHFYAL